MAERGQRFPILLGALVVLLVQRDVALAHTKPPSNPADDKPIVLQTFHGENFDFDLTMLKCTLHECPIQVQLLDAGRVVDHLALPVPAVSRRLKAEAIDQDWGADPGLTAWRSGLEGDYVATAARMLTLAPQVSGLLVSQRYGFEHVKHNHLFVVPRHGKLRVLWKAEEGEGPTWSATQILPALPGQGHDIAYLQAFLDPEEAVAERFEAVRLRWDAVSARLQATPLPDPATPLYLLSLGAYESIAKAREKRSAYSFCLSSYWVLDASPFPGLASSKAVIGKVYRQRSLAETAARSIKSCLPSMSTQVVTWSAPR
jgi:hypothetical protein